MTLLIGKALWDIVDIYYQEPIDWTIVVTNDRLAKKNYQALVHIEIALDKSLFPRIIGGKANMDS